MDNMDKKIKTLITTVGMATLTMHVINRLQFSLYGRNNILASEEDQFYEWRFGKIRYRKKGSGKPVLLIHDLTVGSSSYEFINLVDGLAEKHEVYAIDLLGYGLSDKPNITFTNYLYVQLVIDFIKNVVGRRTDIVASGDSSAIAVMAAHNDGEVIGKLIFLNPQSLSRMNRIPNQRTKLVKFLIELPILGTFIYNMVTSKEYLKNTFAEEYFYNPGMITDKVMDAYVTAAHHTDCNAKFAFASYMGRFMNSNILHALKEIDHSMYIIYGTENEDGESVAEDYISYNHSIEAFPISYTRHLSHLEKPGAVLEQMEILL